MSETKRTPQEIADEICRPIVGRPLLYNQLRANIATAIAAERIALVNSSDLVPVGREYDSGFEAGFRNGVEAAQKHLMNEAQQHFAAHKDEAAAQTRALAKELNQLIK